MNAQRAAAVLGMMLATACATRSARPDALADRFARADARKARELAPDLHARAERARADAQRAGYGDPAARRDRELQATLLLQAAVAEAERIESDRAAAAAEARVTGALHARARLETDRRAIERQIEREQSARDERVHAARVFAWAAQPTSQAVTGRAEREAVHASDVEFLLRRAQLTLAAALALGLPEARAAQVTARIAALGRRAAKTGARVVDAAHEALLEADRALGEARALRVRGAGDPVRAEGSIASANETAALMEMAAERGLEVRSTPRGVLIEVAPLFASSAQPTALGRTRLQQLAGTAAAHPHGAILIEYAAGVGVGPGVGAGAGTAGALRRARARAERVRRELAAATAAARVQLLPVSAGVAPGSVQVVFSAYRAGP